MTKKCEATVRKVCRKADISNPECHQILKEVCRRGSKTTEFPRISRITPIPPIEPIEPISMKKIWKEAFKEE